MLDRLDWRLSGCGEGCRPRQHDPQAHELYGFLLALRTPPLRKIHTGPLEIDLDTHTVRLYGKPVESLCRGPNVGVTRWKLLEILVPNLGRTVSYEEIIRHIYDSESSDAATRHAVVMLLWYLRKELSPVRHLIVTVANIGARLEKEAPYVQEAFTPADQPRCHRPTFGRDSLVPDARERDHQAGYISMPSRPEAPDELRVYQPRKADRRALGASISDEDATRKHEAILRAIQENVEE